MFKPIALTFLLLLPAALQAQCAGQDLRATFSAEEQARLDATLAGRPYPEGNHWRATRGAETIHLIGTMHVDDARFDPVMEQIGPIVENAGRVLLEMTDAEEAKLKTLLADKPEIMVLRDTSLPELLSEEEWRLLTEGLKGRGIPPFVAAKFQPWYVSMLMSLPGCMALSGDIAGGLDGRIKDAAHAADVPLGALEPYDAAISIFADVPMEQQLMILRSGLSATDESTDLFRTLAEIYFEERHAESWAAPDILSARFSPMSPEAGEALFTQFTERLLNQRNRAWIDVILNAAERTEGPLVVAFGAAHLSGDQGVLALLEADGFALERQIFQ